MRSHFDRTVAHKGWTRSLGHGTETSSLLMGNGRYLHRRLCIPGTSILMLLDHELPILEMLSDLPVTKYHKDGARVDATVNSSVAS
jgi:hypothetical protein